MNMPFSISPRDIDGPYGENPNVVAPGAPDVGSILRFAYISLGIFVAIFFLWSILAPLESAAVSSGVLRADGGGRKTVQHLEGGIIEKILVKEGQVVRAGQPLVLLDRTQSSARDAALLTSYYALLAQNARLTAQRTGARRISYPDELMSKLSDPEVRSIVSASNEVFNAQRGAMRDQLTILSQRLGQANAEISSTGSQVTALRDQGLLLEQEAVGVGKLVEEGLERKSRLLSLQRQQAATIGQSGQLVGNLERIRESKGETRAQMSFLRAQQVTEAANQQKDVQVSIAEAKERLNISNDIGRRQQIVAPVDGTVMNLRLVTRGAVLGAGQPILDIVPSHERMIVSARLKANDVDVVYKGLNAEIKLIPYKARVLPMLHGTVRDVSPDATMDEATNTLYYKTEIEIDANELKNLPDVRLVSGMPAEVFISLGSRSLFQYLVQPIIDSFHRAFREP